MDRVRDDVVLVHDDEGNVIDAMPTGEYFSEDVDHGYTDNHHSVVGRGSSARSNDPVRATNERKVKSSPRSPMSQR